MVAETEFNELVGSFDRDPSTFSNALRAYAHANPDAFVWQARKALVTVPPCRALKCILGLLTMSNVLHFLLEEYVRSRDSAIFLAKKILDFEPRLDVALMEYVEDADLANHFEQTVLYALDILDAVSERDRLVLKILTFLKHPNPKLRSKAARMLVRRRPNAMFMDALIKEADPRVRANAIESLFCVPSEYSRKIFRALTNDPDNRVAGNARLGLYLAGEADSLALIDQLGQDQRPAFRKTGAWVMGRTADPRFSLSLGRLMTDADEGVRAVSFRAMRHLKHALKMARDKDPLNISPLHYGREGDHHRLSVALFNPDGKPLKEIPGTQFLLRVAGEFVRHYSVQEYDAPNSLNLAFALCLSQENEEEALRQSLEALQHCLSMQRSSDSWSVVKLTQNSHWARFGQPADHSAPADRQSRSQYTCVRAQIEAMLRERPIYLNGKAQDEALPMAMNKLLITGSCTSNPEIVFCGEPPPDAILNLLLKRRTLSKFRVHAAIVGETVPTLLSELVEVSCGTLQACRSEELTQSLVKIYSTLVHRYELRWQHEGHEINLSVDSASARGSLTTRLE